MPNVRILPLLGIAAAFAAAVPQAARAQSFDIPDGFTSAIVRESGFADRPIPILRVRPDGGRFAGLSTIDLVPLPGPVEAPDDWLRSRVTAVPESALPDPRTMLDGPDSPFSGPSFDALRDTLGRWVDGIAGLGELPLEFCGEPGTGRNRAGSYREMRCALPLGPFRRHLAMRLQEAGGIWYYTRISTMNSERLPDLLAIADSFGAAPAQSGRTQ